MDVCQGADCRESVSELQEWGCSEGPSPLPGPERPDRPCWVCAIMTPHSCWVLWSQGLALNLASCTHTGGWTRAVCVQD